MLVIIFGLVASSYLLRPGERHTVTQHNTYIPWYTAQEKKSHGDAGLRPKKVARVL